MIKIRKTTTYVSGQGEVNEGPSLTIPNMVPDIRTLIRRYRQGQAVPMMNGAYSSEDFPELDRMDKTEIAQFRMDLADQMAADEKHLHALTKELEDRNRNTQVDPAPAPEI